MTDFSIYDQKLWQNMWVAVVACAVVVTILTVVLIKEWVGLKKPAGKSDRKEKIIWAVTTPILILFMIVLIVQAADTVYCTNYDVRNQAYILYRGEYKVSYTWDGTKCLTFTEEGVTRRFVLHNERNEFTDVWTIPAGTYSGEILYSDKTELIWDYGIAEYRSP